MAREKLRLQTLQALAVPGRPPTNASLSAPTPELTAKVGRSLDPREKSGLEDH